MSFLVDLQQDGEIIEVVGEYDTEIDACEDAFAIIEANEDDTLTTSVVEVRANGNIAIIDYFRNAKGEVDCREY